VACDATTRLYDVDEDAVVFKKLEKTARYDQGNQYGLVASSSSFIA